MELLRRNAIGDLLGVSTIWGNAFWRMLGKGERVRCWSPMKKDDESLDRW